MSSTLSQRAQNTKLIQRIAQIEETVMEMRTNQAKKLSFAGITLDGTGTAGTGTITSAAGSVVDANGLVSSVNFTPTDLFNGSAGLTTSSTSFVDVSGGALGTITTTRTIRVFFYLMGYMYNDSFVSSTGSDIGELIIYDSFVAGSVANVQTGGSAYTYFTAPGGVITVTQGENDAMVSRTGLVDVNAGTHHYKLQYHALNGGTVHLDAYQAGYVILGI